MIKKYSFKIARFLVILQHFNNLITKDLIIRHNLVFNQKIFPIIFFRKSTARKVKDIKFNKIKHMKLQVIQDQIVQLCGRLWKVEFVTGKSNYWTASHLKNLGNKEWPGRNVHS